MDHIIFCWVLHQQDIINHILSQLDIGNCRVVTISLTCSKSVLESRLRKDVANGLRNADVIERSVKRIPMYHELDTIKIDTSEKTAEEVAEMILKL